MSIKVSPYITPAEFCANQDHVDKLKAFLASEAGEAFLSVMLGMSPVRQSLRAPMLPDSIEERASQLLGKSQGYEYAFELMTQTLTQLVRPSAPASTKASGRSDIRPARPPKP
jgi:hypothetical protein